MEPSFSIWSRSGGCAVCSVAYLAIEQSSDLKKGIATLCPTDLIRC